MIKKRERIIAKKWLSPFWNWETYGNDAKVVVAYPIEFWNPDPLFTMVTFNNDLTLPVVYTD